MSSIITGLTMITAGVVFPMTSCSGDTTNTIYLINGYQQAGTNGITDSISITVKTNATSSIGVLDLSNFNINTGGNSVTFSDVIDNIDGSYTILITSITSSFGLITLTIGIKSVPNYTIDNRTITCDIYHDIRTPINLTSAHQNGGIINTQNSASITVETDAGRSIGTLDFNNNFDIDTGSDIVTFSDITDKLNGYYDITITNIISAQGQIMLTISIHDVPSYNVIGTVICMVYHKTN